MEIFTRLMRTVAFLAAVVLLSSCDTFVSDVGDPDDVATDEALNSPEQVPFLINGVRSEFADQLDLFTVPAGGISDELLFTNNISTATFPTFDDLDDGTPTTSNNSVDNAFNNVGAYRLLADGLVNRVQNNIDFGGDTAQRDEALFVGQFHGGLARYFYATYIGLNAGEGGGGIINNGPFIPANEMYDRAITDLDSALAVVGSDSYRGRLINTVKARVYLFQADTDGANADQAYQNARAAAQQGLVEGDAPYQAQYISEDVNQWYFDAGPGRAQFIASNRYAQYGETSIISGGTPSALADARDAALDTSRVVLYLVGGLAPSSANYDSLHPPLAVQETPGGPVGVYPQQGLYVTRDSNIDFATWQENALMLAELSLRLDSDDDAALDLVNSVRASHSLDALDSISLMDDGDGDGSADENTIVVERDKELFGQGMRLPDQRRFGIPFDIEATGEPIEGPWRYFPVTESERNANENID